MSDSNLLDKYKRPAAGEHVAKVVPIHEEAEPDDLGCFGYLRGAKSLELCKLNGDVLAVPYAYISRFEFHADSGAIEIFLPDRCVRIRGLKLNTRIDNIRLFECLHRHRVPWIMEASRNQALAAGNEGIVIESIDWEIE